MGLIPCAGRSRRMGRPKALLDAGGAPFVARGVRTLLAGGCDAVLVVIRRGDGAVSAAAAEAGARVVVSHAPEEDGPIGSIRAGLQALGGGAELPERAGALVLLPVDHPRVRPETVARLLEAYRAPGAAPAPAVVVPRFGSRRGHPVVFAARVFPELLDPALEGGARSVVRRDPARVMEAEVDDAGVVDDLDTPEAYRAAFGTDPTRSARSTAGEDR